MAHRDEATFYGRLQKAMDDQGWPERGRASRLAFGLANPYGLSASADTIRSWERIKGVPQDTRIVFALAAMLNVDAVYLFGRNVFERDSALSSVLSGRGVGGREVDAVEAAEGHREAAAGEEGTDVAGNDR